MCCTFDCPSSSKLLTLLERDLELFLLYLSLKHVKQDRTHSEDSVNPTSELTQLTRLDFVICQYPESWLKALLGICRFYSLKKHCEFIYSLYANNIAVDSINIWILRKLKMNYILFFTLSIGTPLPGQSITQENSGKSNRDINSRESRNCFAGRHFRHTLAWSTKEDTI